MDWLEERKKEHIERIMSKNPKAGWFCQTTWTTSGVWFQLTEIDKFWAEMYTWRRQNYPTDGTERELTYNIRNVVEKVPKGSHIVYCKEGAFGSTQRENQKPLSELPKEYWQD